jgi:hypothetical protein
MEFAGTLRPILKFSSHLREVGGAISALPPRVDISLRVFDVSKPQWMRPGVKRTWVKRLAMTADKPKRNSAREAVGELNFECHGQCSEARQKRGLNSFNVKLHFRAL